MGQLLSHFVAAALGGGAVFILFALGIIKLK